MVNANCRVTLRGTDAAGGAAPDCLLSAAVQAAGKAPCSLPLFVTAD
jgi:hypothetical protein